jgi:hypothetical protein
MLISHHVKDKTKHEKISCLARNIYTINAIFYDTALPSPTVARLLFLLESLVCHPHHVKNVSHLILPPSLLANERSFASLILPPKDARLPSSGRRGAYTPSAHLYFQQIHPQALYFHLRDKSATSNCLHKAIANDELMVFTLNHKY